MAQPGSGPAHATGNSTMLPAITDQEIDERERVLRANIAKNFGRIHEVERELAELQLELRMNIDPKKQAMEMIRQKIEEQNHVVSTARHHFDEAKKAFEAAEKQLELEEQRKAQLCDELGLLVQQANRSQLEKLEQLTSRLDTLNAGMNAGAAAAALRQDAAALKEAMAVTSTSNTPENGGNQPAADGTQQQQQPDQQQPALTSEQDAAQKAELEANQRAEKQRAEAAAARSRHVSLGGSGSGRGRGRQSQLNAVRAAPAREARDANGQFSGFD